MQSPRVYFNNIGSICTDSLRHGNGLSALLLLTRAAKSSAAKISASKTRSMESRLYTLLSSRHVHSDTNSTSLESIQPHSSGTWMARSGWNGRTLHRFHVIALYPLYVDNAPKMLKSINISLPNDPSIICERWQAEKRLQKLSYNRSRS